MPILDQQRRVHEVGRIRLGVQGADHPRALSTFRFTSARADLIEQIAAQLGGEPRAWQDQHEVLTDADTLDVLIPPADVGFSQWHELWSAAGCQRRCDGFREVLTDAPCICSEEGQRKCDDVTRLSVLLPIVRTFGLWRVETHSWYAAAELRSAMELALGVAARTGEHLAQGTLRIEQRAVKRPGQSVQRFSVPVLDVALSALAIAESSPATHTAAVSARDALALVAPSDGDEAESTRARSRGAATAPVVDLPPADDDGEPPTLQPAQSDDDERARIMRRMFAAISKQFSECDKDQRDALRHALAVMVTTKSRGDDGQPPASSWNDLTRTELVRVEQLLRDCENSAMVAAPRADGGWTFTLAANGRTCDIYQANGAWTYNVQV